MAPVYVGVVVLVLGYLVASTLLQDVQNQTASALLDPFGFLSSEVVTRYWTPAERNRDLMPAVSMLGLNRLVWTGVGVALLAIALARFRPTVEEQRGGGQVRGETSRPLAVFPKTAPTMTTAGYVRAAASFAWMYFREVQRSPVYWAFVLSGLGFVVIVLSVSKEIFGTTTLPLTYQVLELAIGSFTLFTLITITFYAGELVWRERDVGMADIVDATRAPTWVGFLAKLLALVLIALSLEGVIAAAALVSQVTRGFFAIEWRLYAFELLVLHFGRTLAICVLSLVVQVVVNHKYVGHFMMVLYYALQPVLGYLGVEDRLVRYGSEPRAQYSDMNGYGHLLGAVLWYRLYWFAVERVLVVCAYLLFVRGRETTRRGRLGEARARFTGAWKGALALGVLGCAVFGAFIFYNTHVLNPYRTSKDEERSRADSRSRSRSRSSAATTPGPRPRSTATTGWR